MRKETRGWNVLNKEDKTFWKDEKPDINLTHRETNDAWQQESRLVSKERYLKR